MKKGDFYVPFFLKFFWVQFDIFAYRLYPKNQVKT
jgi:hypothetical protein